ncbi:MAG: chemotaxis protein CheW [Rubrivivax sp.]|nr:chemotaxis protein CheW [Rubrivivax sp.]
MDIVEELLPHMRHVLSADRDLRDLSMLWTMIEAASAISCPEHAESVLSTLSQTRERFSALQQRLVQQLGLENLAELRDELSATAQCTIDILVRNLFERTADVGFLATDDVLRAFCQQGEGEQMAQRDAFQQRLAEYRDKYTVYDDIVVTDPHGRLLARLDTSRPEQTQTQDPLIGLACAAEGYVEQFAASDLSCDDQPTLLYAHRIRSEAGQLLGVLVLRFRLRDEMQRIFAGSEGSRRQVALVLVDDEDRVVISNDEAHVPLGARMRGMTADDVSLMTFAGREYLGVCCPTRGYQGYRGPSWRAMAMVSLLVAFNHRHATGDVAEDVALESQELRQIQLEVDAINRNLRRMVWNGRVASRSAASGQLQLKAVLQQVNDAGVAMRSRVGRAIGELYRTAMGRTQQQASELARLAADIMDRNLYERANDCRWWALSPVVRRVLSLPRDEAGTRELQGVLAYINSLYTVYTRILAFDGAGVIRGISNDTSPPQLGSTVDGTLRELAMGLQDPQQYRVTPFGPTVLNEGESTYVYVAGVRHPDSGRPVGGIAIVFNSQREFRAMLDDVLDSRRGLAAFIDAQGTVISSTDEQLPPGAAWPLGLEPRIVAHQGVHYAMSVRKAGGYREFKTTDGYRNDVYAAVALRLGAIERRGSSLADHSFRSAPVAERRHHREFALFHVGANLCALPADAVIEALPSDRLVRTPRAQPLHAGLLEVGTGDSRQLIAVACARQLMGVTYPARQEDGVVLVMNRRCVGEDPTRPLLGLRVDGVSQVLDLDARQLQELPAGMRRLTPWTSGILKLAASDGETSLLQVQDPAALAATFFPQAGLALPPAEAAPREGFCASVKGRAVAA